MSQQPLKVGVLTSSRADYGIYTSLLDRFRREDFIDYGLFVFGTHLSEKHGATVTEIRADGHPVWEEVRVTQHEESNAGVAEATGRTTVAFAGVFARWAGRLDVVFALGDRFEMFAAVAASVPFNLTVAHLFGGSTTLGAIDDRYRHAISMLATLHFASLPSYAERLRGMVVNPEHVYYVGSISLDNLSAFRPLSVDELRSRFGTDFSTPTVLVTYHPETVAMERNLGFIEEFCTALHSLAVRYRIVITMPNADPMGSVFRERYEELAAAESNVQLVESFGRQGYLSAVHHCHFLLGNTSSNLSETAAFGKRAINVGDRQQGRLTGENVTHVANNHRAILRGVAAVEEGGVAFTGQDIYRKSGNAAGEITDVLRNWWANQLKTNA